MSLHADEVLVTDWNDSSGVARKVAQRIVNRVTGEAREMPIEQPTIDQEFGHQAVRSRGTDCP